MKAMILAAGLGTRLAPLTNKKPKALIEVNGKPLLEMIIEKLKLFGFSKVIINVHHFSDKVIKYLQSNNNFGIDIQISDEKDLLLDTGGAIKKAAKFFTDGQPFLVHNVDIISDIDLNKLINYHIAYKPLVTVVVNKRESSRYFLFDDDLNLRGWENIKTGEKIIKNPSSAALRRFAFNGIHIVDPKIFKHFPGENVFSIIDFYLNLCSFEIIKGYVSEANFFDIGTMEKLNDYTKFLNN